MEKVIAPLPPCTDLFLQFLNPDQNRRLLLPNYLFHFRKNIVEILKSSICFLIRPIRFIFKKEKFGKKFCLIITENKGRFPLLSTCTSREVNFQTATNFVHKIGQLTHRFKPPRPTESSRTWLWPSPKQVQHPRAIA